MSKGPQPVHYKDGEVVPGADLKVISRGEDADWYICRCLVEGCTRRVRVYGSRLRSGQQKTCGGHAYRKYGRPIPPDAHKAHRS